MNKDLKERLEKRGWTLGNAEDFLELGPDEVAMVETRLTIAAAVRQLRAEQSLTQAQVAGKLGSSQSRVARVEAADDSVALDLLVRTFFALGATRQDLARVIAADAG